MLEGGSVQKIIMSTAEETENREKKTPEEEKGENSDDTDSTRYLLKRKIDLSTYPLQPGHRSWAPMWRKASTRPERGICNRVDPGIERRGGHPFVKKDVDHGKRVTSYSVMSLKGARAFTTCVSRRAWKTSLQVEVVETTVR